MSRTRLTISLIALAALAAGSVVVTAQDAPQRWRGRIIDMGGPFSGQTAYLTLQADQWTSDASMEQLATTLVDQGQDALLKEVAALPAAGWITIGNGLRYEMRTMRSLDLPDGTRLIRSVTDRPIQIAEVTRSTRSRQYAFGLVELYLQADGTGQGRVLPAAQIEFEHGQVEITSLGTQPYVVVKVSPQKIKSKAR